MKELGYSHAGRSDAPETLFDNVRFDPKGDLEAYAKGFSVHNLKG
jgi:nitrate/nitrite transport system substrate-binding protein